MLKINHIQKRFGKLTVLKDVTLCSEPGEIIHISGRNGSGKSTLFKILTGIIKQDKGTYEIGNNDTIGALIENPGFLEYESGLDNLKFLAQLNNNYDETKVKKLMKDFYLDPDNNQMVKKYSIGMRQKLGIIQAIMEDQTIILLDEPTRGIDHDSIKAYKDIIYDLRKEKKIILVASHEEESEIKYDRKLELVEGTLIEKSCN